MSCRTIRRVDILRENKNEVVGSEVEVWEDESMPDFRSKEEHPSGPMFTRHVSAVEVRSCSGCCGPSFPNLSERSHHSPR